MNETKSNIDVSLEDRLKALKDALVYLSEQRRYYALNGDYDRARSIEIAINEIDAYHAMLKGDPKVSSGLR